MALVDLALTPTEQSGAEKMSEVPGYDAPKYPWGLEISFDDQTLSKLARSSSDFTVSDEFEMTVRVKVSRVSSYETDSGVNQSVGMCITAVDLPKREQDRAEILYGER